MRRQPFAHALDHTVVKDVGPLIKRPLRRKYHQAIEQQASRSQTVHHAQRPRALQHFNARFFAGISLPRQYARNGTDRQLRAAGDFGDF